MDILNKDATVIEIDQDVYAQWLNSTYLPNNSQVIIDNSGDTLRVFLLKLPETQSKRKKSNSLFQEKKFQPELLNEQPKKTSWVSSFVSKLEKKKELKEEKLERKLTPQFPKETPKFDQKKENMTNNIKDQLKINDFQKAWEILDDQTGNKKIFLI